MSSTGRLRRYVRAAVLIVPAVMVAVAAAAAIRYHSRSRNPQGCHVSLPPSGTAISFISMVIYDFPNVQKGKCGKEELE